MNSYDERSFNEKTKRYRNIVNDTLTTAMMRPDIPAKLSEAMNYTLFAGGKRFRSCLTLGVCDMLAGNRKMAIKLACGIEMIHSYSLIHDDLPCMDDDDIRRGKPTSHKVFGEAQALLAGDALLTYAFQYMVESGLSFNDPGYYRAVAEIAKRSGPCGMVAGQSLDLISEENGTRDERELYYIHSHKTADLLVASILAGAYCSNITETQLKSLQDFGEKVGLLFQITDDILDAEGDSEQLGKAVNKDYDKLTYVTLYGLERAKDRADTIAAEAEGILFTNFGDNCKFLYDTVGFILNRRS